MRWASFVTRRLGGLRGVADLLLILLFGSLAFAVSCNELYDSDVWWHLRSGQWIVEHGRAPYVDPFTFGSEGRPWIDLHWLFQLLVLLAFRAGGLGAVILFAAAVITLAVLLALAARPRGGSVVVVLLCWLAALVLIGFRSQPRPEILTLLFLSCYLAILSRADDRPALAWLLPAVQLLWVNSQGLFALGPAVLGLWLSARLVPLFWQRLRGRAVAPARPRRWWGHVLGASLLVVVVCLLNPYGVNGALFPLALYPKVTQEGNPYKESAQEFFSARKVASLVPPENVADEWFFCALHLVLLLLPLSFLLPAVWEASRRGPAPPPDASPRAWLAALVALVALLAVRTLTLTAAGRPPWLAGLGRFVPALFVAAGVAAGLAFRQRSRTAAALALAGGVSMAAWVAWLHDHLLVRQPVQVGFGQQVGVARPPQGRAGAPRPGREVVQLAVVLLGPWGAGLIAEGGESEPVGGPQGGPNDRGVERGQQPADGHLPPPTPHLPLGPDGQHERATRGQSQREEGQRHQDEQRRGQLGEKQAGHRQTGRGQARWGDAVQHAPKRGR
jgi:hypothetical protein